MNLPLTITWHRLSSAPAIEEQVREYVDRLEHFYPHIIACHVLIEVPHRRHLEGRLFHVRLDLTVPGAELVVGRDPAAHHAHEDLHVALRDAFRAARAMLQDWVRRRRGEAKLHEATLHEGHIEGIFVDDGFGFIAPLDGGPTIYFHEHAIDGAALMDLAIGQPVHYAVEDGLNGPQAVVVHLASRAGAQIDADRGSAGTPRAPLAQSAQGGCDDLGDTPGGRFRHAPRG